MFDKKAGKPRSQIDSLIGVGTHVHGNIKFNGGVRIDGRVTGNITALGDKPSTLVLSDHGVVEGVIQVSHVVINGTVVGAIKASVDIFLQNVEPVLMFVVLVLTFRLLLKRASFFRKLCHISLLNAVH